MFSKSPLKPSRISKHKILKHFVETADRNMICNYYKDPYFQLIPSVVLLDYIRQLAEDGYLKPMWRHVVLNVKAYSYLPEYRSQRRKSIIQHLTRPVSHLLTWALGIASALLIEYLINLINSKP